jgi:uncharacterized membrane protein
MKTVRIMNWVMALAGLWAGTAPFILRFGDVRRALWNGLIIGAVVIVLSLVAALSEDNSNVKSIDWVNAVLGLWLVFAPFILGYTATVVAMWSSIVAGIVLLVLAVWTEVSFPKLISHA